MAGQGVTRRDVLRGLAVGAVASSVLRVIPLEAAQMAHNMVQAEAASGAYVPKYFKGEQFELLKSLCVTIIPSDEGHGGAIEAAAPEFIDLLTSENPEYQRVLGSGLDWLDRTCSARFGSKYLACTAAQQQEVLQLIAYRKNAVEDPALEQPVASFAFLRKLTADGYFTSAIGIKDLQYIGNTALREFSGCPPVPEC